MSFDWHARSIVNQAIRANSDSHHTLLMGKSLKWDLGMSRSQAMNVIADIEHETDKVISDDDIKEHREDLLELTVGELYEITKAKLRDNGNN